MPINTIWSSSSELEKHKSTISIVHMTGARKGRQGGKGDDVCYLFAGSEDSIFESMCRLTSVSLSSLTLGHFVVDHRNQR